MKKLKEYIASIKNNIEAITGIIILFLLAIAAMILADSFVEHFIN